MLRVQIYRIYWAKNNFPFGL